MDGLRLVPPSSLNSFKVDRRKARKGPVSDVTCSVKSFRARNFPGSDVRQQSRNRTLGHKVTNFNEFSSNSSSQSSITNSDSSPVIRQRSSSFKSSDIFIENPKVDNTVKRNSRNKARKKGKLHKKLSESADPEILPEDYAPGILTSETCGNNEVDHADMLVSYAASQEDSSSDSRVNINHVEENDNRIVRSSESPKVCTSSVDELELLEAKVPSGVKNFPEAHPLTDSKMMIQMEDQGSITDVGAEETHHSQIRCYDGIHSNRFSDMHDCQVLDSVSVGSNSDNSTTTSCDAKPHDRGSRKFGFSESLDFSPRKACFSPQNLLDSVVDFHDYTEETRYGNQDFNGSNMQVAVPDKRSKKAKMVLRSSTARNSHVRTGKENNHRVWQKVQKNDADECDSEFKKVSSRFPVTQKAPSSLRRNSTVATIDMPSKSEDRKQLKDKVSKKLKRKTSPGSKHEFNSYAQRASNPSKTSPNTCAKIGIQQNETVDICERVNDQKRLSSFPRSGSPELGCQSGKVESFNSELFNGSQDCPETSESTGSFSDAVSAMKEQQQDSSLSKSCCSLELDMVDVPSPVYLPHLMVNEVSRTEKDISLAECVKQNHNSGSLLQKWIPIGTKDPQSTTSARCSSSSLVQCDRQGLEDWNLRNNFDEKTASPFQNLISSLNVGIMRMGLGSERNSTQEDENSNVLLRNMNAYTLKENNSKHVATDCLISESNNQNFSAFETELNKIAQSVNDSFRMQVASEAVQMFTGGPIAEFERFLHFSSPVIFCSPNLISCKCCSDQVGGVSLCRHETPNVPLGCMWQWYEKHGSYGLEIRAEDYEQTNRLGVDRFSFRAYFVPFLSAVQLFRNCKSHSANNSHGFPAPGVTKPCEIGEKLQSSANVRHLPIFSLLVPQPRTADASVSPPVKEVCKSELSSVSHKEDLSIPSVDMSRSDDVELLFEYFESDQPRQRRPLYEK